MKTNSKFRRAKRTFKRVIKGKVFEKSEFGTGLGDYTLRGLLSRVNARPDGYRTAPSSLVIPAAINIESPLEPVPVKIYVGTEPAQHRAARVLVWSIYKNRNPERQYEIFLMEDLAGFSRKGWKTGFTAYRYAIPEFADYQGRAIYNDVDQIYLDDPGKLFDQPMHNKAVLALDSIDTSVMLMNCAALNGLWSRAKIAEAQQERLHASMIERVAKPALVDNLPPRWNARDHEYTCGESCLLHYTILHTQPWEPFPSQLKYTENTNASLWRALEQEADQHNFALEWKTYPGQSYTSMEAYFANAG